MRILSKTLSEVTNISATWLFSFLGWLQIFIGKLQNTLAIYWQCSTLLLYYWVHTPELQISFTLLCKVGALIVILPSGCIYLTVITKKTIKIKCRIN